MAAPYSMHPFSERTAGTLARKCARISSRLPGFAVMTATTWIMAGSPYPKVRRGSLAELLQRLSGPIEDGHGQQQHHQGQHERDPGTPGDPAAHEQGHRAEGERAVALAEWAVVATAGADL